MPYLFHHASRLYAIASLCACAICLATPGYAGANPGEPGPPVQPCYANVTRSCAMLHAVEGRNCGSGSHAIPCGDIIISDNTISDIAAAASGQAGKVDLDIPCGNPVDVWVHKFRCAEASCQDQGVKKFTCYGRCAIGADCVGGVANP